jgi:hypothetical protein
LFAALGQFIGADGDAEVRSLDVFPKAVLNAASDERVGV